MKNNMKNCDISHDKKKISVGIQDETLVFNTKKGKIKFNIKTMAKCFLTGYVICAITPFARCAMTDHLHEYCNLNDYFGLNHQAKKISQTINKNDLDYSVKYVPDEKIDLDGYVMSSNVVDIINIEQEDGSQTFVRSMVN